MEGSIPEGFAGSAEPLFIAVDGGGTKTEILLLTSAGTVVDSVRLGPSNPNACGIEGACALLKNGIASLTLEKYGRPPSAIYAGIAGALSGDNGRRLADFLSAEFPGTPVKVETDIFNIIASAGIEGKCIAAIAGTGTVVYAADGDSVRRIGGWGWMFDEGGSGFDIGRAAIRAALAAGDGLTERSLLVSLVEAKLGRQAWDAIGELYKKDREYIASFARCVFDAAEKGDASANEIILANARRLATLIKAAAKQYGCGPRTVVSGGLARNAALFSAALKEELGSSFELIIPTDSPSAGACRRCLSLFSSPRC